MADSDDEYDRKRRDKFRGERSAGDNYRSDRRDDRSRGREEWQERGRGGRPDYRDYRQVRDRYSPGREAPPMKRMRGDWDDGRPRYGGHEPYGGYGGWPHDHYHLHGGHGFGGHAPGIGGMHPRRPEPVPNPDVPTQPQMMTLKQFLATQDDSISDSDAITKYNEYKLEFKRQQLNEFFVAHKDEEWFKIKYHPEESMKRRDEQLAYLNKRVQVFAELLEKGGIGGSAVSVDTTQTEQLLRLLDTVVIKLEDGTEEDLKALDEKAPEFVRPPFEPPPIRNGREKIDITQDEEDWKPIEKIPPPQKKPVVDDVEWVKGISHKQTKPPIVACDDDWDEDEVPEPAPSALEDDWNLEPPPKSPLQEAIVDCDDDWDADYPAPVPPPTAAKLPERKLEEEIKMDEDENEEAKVQEEINDEDSHEDENEKEKLDEENNSEKSRKRKISNSNSSSSSSSSSDSDTDEKNEEGDDKSKDEELNNFEQEKAKDVEKPQNDIVENPGSVKSEPEKETDSDPKQDCESNDAEKSVENKEEPAATEDSGEPVTEKKMNVDEEGEEKKGDQQEKPANNEEGEGDGDDKTETIDLDKEKDQKDEKSPRHLHRTSSIFLRNLAPTITKSEVEGMCKKYNGFLRVAIADPLGERRWFRRGWVTFRRDVNIKEICWHLNNIRLRDCELGAIVNRDLSRRVRPVNGLTCHKTIVRSDIKLCAKIAHNLDEKSGLWRESASDVDKSAYQSSESFGFNSHNPVLQNITDYLIEEASAEEDELLGLNSDNKDSIDGESIERDPQLLTALDKLILYLRIVHSVDFYNHCEYPYEDEMPNRCGIIHARGPAPQKSTNQEILDYTRNFENKMTSFLAKSTTIEEEELKKLGAKDAEAEVEKFVQANSQELSKDKWLCPLSGKKFKGPDFIRKHIFNKHGEKVDEVRKEVEYFNNYLKDSKRPQLPDHPGSNKKAEPAPGGGFRGAGGYPHPAYSPAYAPYVPPAIVPPRPRPGGFGPRRGPGAEYRPIIHYRDLDAPREPDEFI